MKANFKTTSAGTHGFFFTVCTISFPLEFCYDQMCLLFVWLSAKDKCIFVAQSQNDFQTGVVPLRSPQSEVEQHEIENECLGMAVLAITHYAMNEKMPLSTASHEIR